ncbi:MAG: DUF697 domain-containing protein [Gammaproteobacteria bacterium]
MIWRRVRNGWPSWLWPRKSSSTSDAEPPRSASDQHLQRARESLRSLLDDPQLPQAVRVSLAPELGEVQTMLDKLEYGHLHIAVFGRVGVGKSALLNALLGERRFSTSPLHGETRSAQTAAWQEWDAGGVFLIDTPGINDVDGEAREREAHQVARRADLIVFVVDGDIAATELAALRQVVEAQRPVLLAFNKTDRYVEEDRRLLEDTLAERVSGLLTRDRIVCVAADPAPHLVIEIDAQGRETERWQRPAADVERLRETLWAIIEAEGKTLAALNATLFAGQVSDRISARIMAIKEDLATRLIHGYCLMKGVAVGFNPVPVTDLVAAGAIDVSLVLHLSRIYGCPVSVSEAGRLIRTIGAQMMVIMGTVWAVHFVASAMKGGTAGLSTILTGATQGAVAYVSAYIVGRVARDYFAQGRSWGPTGPKRVVEEILASLDQDSLLSEAREQIGRRLRAAASG